VKETYQMNQNVNNPCETAEHHLNTVNCWSVCVHNWIV